MKLLLPLFLLLSPGLCRADTFILKDGGRLEGEVTGEMEGVVMVKTKYGSLTINRADIQEQQAAQPAPAPLPAAPVEISTAQPQVEVSTAQPAQVEASTQAPAIDPSTAAPEGVVAAAPKLTFRTVQAGTEARLLVYSENGIIVATETYNPEGALTGLEGLMADGTYTEYYPEGALKTVRTMMGGKANGTLKSFYPSGGTQAEAYYFVGGREGQFKYYTEEGRPLLQAEYKNDKLNGWKKEYGPDGALASEAYYIDGRPAAAPGAQAATAAGAELAGGQDSQVTVRTIRLTRGERFEFRLNGRYIGKAHMDKAFNIISLEGKIPDGAVKVYSKEGKLERELVFKNNDIIMLRIYGPIEDSVSAIDFTVIADSKYDQLVKEISDAGANLKNRSIALIPFSDSDEKASRKNANIISERILTKLIKSGTFKIIERNLLDKVLKELNLQASGAIDPENTKKLGGILEVEAIITGTIAEPSHGEIEVNARLIDVETAQVIGASRILLDKSGASTKSGEYIFKNGQAIKKKL